MSICPDNFSSISDQSTFQDKSELILEGVHRINAKRNCVSTDPFTVASIDATITRDILNPKNKAYFIWLKNWENNDVLAGYVIADYIKNPEKKLDLHVTYITVDVDCSRRGLGTELMKKIFQIAKSENLMVTLEHDATEDLNKFYQNFNPVKINYSPMNFAKPLFDPVVSLKALN
jgi:ribosomal protein S18 acetylase RimI-like enzyme